MGLNWFLNTVIFNYYPPGDSSAFEDALEAESSQDHDEPAHFDIPAVASSQAPAANSASSE